MRQKYSITVAGVSMNIVCEETQETVDAAVNALNAQISDLTASVFQVLIVKFDAHFRITRNHFAKSAACKQQTDEARHKDKSKISFHHIFFF